MCMIMMNINKHLILKKKIADIIFVSQDIAAYYYYLAVSERTGATIDDETEDTH